MNAKARIPQIDGLKGIAIICVLIIHSIPLAYQSEYYFALYFTQAVPIFIIAMGLTWYISFRKSELSGLMALYSKGYLKRKFSRFFIPYLLIATIVILMAISTNGFGINKIATLALTVIGIAPPPLPGGYFIPIILQLIFVAPLLYYSFRKAPVIALIATIVIDLGFELSGPYIPYSLYYGNILRYIAALGIGFYIAPELLSKGKIDLKDRRFFFIAPLAVSSAILIVLYYGSSFSFFRPEWSTQNVLTFFFPALFVILIFNLYIYISRIDKLRFLELIGRASYHIFLVQMLFFYFLLYDSSYGLLFFAIPTSASAFVVIMALIAGLCINIILGILFFRAEEKLREKYKKKHVKVKETMSPGHSP